MVARALLVWGFQGIHGSGFRVWGKVWGRQAFKNPDQPTAIFEAADMVFHPEVYTLNTKHHQTS